MRYGVGVRERVSVLVLDGVKVAAGGNVAEGIMIPVGVLVGVREIKTSLVVSP